MSSDEWKLENHMCRCCHSEGSFKGLAECCNFGKEEGIYADMLQFTLDINLTPVEGSLCSPTYTICEPCIQKLQEATSFKRQVLLCEERFRDMYSRNFIKVAVDVQIKNELPEEDPEAVEDVPFNDNDEDFDIEDDSNDYKEFKISDTVKYEIKKKLKSVTKKTKSQPKPKKPPKKSKLKKNEEVTEKNGEGGKTASRPKFRLQAIDYRQEGNVYWCNHCDKKYEQYCSLKYHVRTKHYNIPKYFCPYCSQGFMTPAPLTIHKLEEHKVDERFKCNACKGMFNSKIQLKKHKNIFHMLGEKHKCELCDYESFSLEGIYKHKFKHKTVKDYHCSFCKKSFVRKTTLELHERIHRGDKRKVCKICGQSFVQKASLNYHMSKYHPEVNF